MKSDNTKNPSQNNSVPTWEKYTMSIREAAQYFNVGEKKLRQLAEGNPPPAWVLFNGSHLQIKRKAFEAFLDDSYSI